MKSTFVILACGLCAATALSVGGWWIYSNHKESAAAGKVYAAALAKIEADHTPAEVLDVKKKWTAWVKQHPKEERNLRQMIAKAQENAEVNLFDETRTKPLVKAVEETAFAILEETGQADKDSAKFKAKMAAEDAEFKAKMAKIDAEAAADADKVLEEAQQRR
jgi:hypothetical protein